MCGHLQRFYRGNMIIIGYFKKMKFKGDLLLTDPLYIIKHDSKNDWDLLLSEG